jgi:hypothetical protein
MRIVVASALCAAGLSCLFLFSSCSYLTGGPYPAYDQRIVAMTDFNAAVKAASGGSALQQLYSVEYLESKLSSGVFAVLGTEDGAQRLVTLDGGSLGAPVAYAFGAGTLFGMSTGFGLSASGDYVRGQVALKWDTRVQEPYNPPSHGILLSEGGGNYCFSASGSSLSIDSYDSSWGSPAVATKAIANAGTWTLVSAGQGGGYYSFLFHHEETQAFRAFRTTSVASMPWTSLFDDPTVSADDKTAEFSAESYSLSITADGPVSVSYSNNGLVFSLLNFGASASTSTYTIKNTGSQTYYFEPSGSYWFMYDQTTGRLSKLRTWWK